MESLNITYRAAETADWGNLAKFRNIYSVEGFEKAKATFEIDFVKPQETHTNILYIAEADSEIVGYGRAGLFEYKNEIPIYGQTFQVPEGYYTKGLLIHEKVRGQGVGIELTKMRGQWVREFSDKFYCILNRKNTISVNMHLKMNFKELRNDLRYPGDNLDESNGSLYLRQLRRTTS